MTAPDPAPDWRASWSRRFQARAIPFLVAPIVGALGRTYRWRVDGAEHMEAVARSGHPPIMALWHGRILPATLYFRDRGIVAVTSANFDGEWIAAVLRRFGYGSARGSSSRGGARALVEIRKLMAQGRAAGFTLDGPRGPAKVAQPGAVFLSQVTGHPILPFHIEASKAWTAKSWDRTQVPKPGAIVGVAIGEPFVVTTAIDDAGRAAACRDLEARLAGLETRARALLDAR
ncbi:MAG: lysophospholipid acyltransferase family protein [Vicinamibacteraceae bacterium]